jgi:hypothetical protein
MATLEPMPRDAAQHIFRLAFFRDYASLSVRQLKFLLKDRDVSIDGVVEKHELVELAHASDAASGTESDVNQRGVRRGKSEYGPPSGADPKLPPSVEVPQLPRPEVYVHKRDAPQVPFDPVGVTLGLNAVKAAVHISMVSNELGDVVMDDTLWSAPLDALEEAFEDGEDPGTDKTKLEGLFAPPGSDKYRDLRHKESWDTLSVFNQYHALLRYVKVLCEDYFKACHIDVRSVAGSYYMAQQADDYWRTGGEDGFYMRGDKKRPRDWYEDVFTDATLGRMVWNSYSPCLRYGDQFFDYWEILLRGANAFEHETGNSERWGELVPEDLKAQGYIKSKPYVHP